MSRVDDLLDRGADRLQALADEWAAEGGGKAKLADDLAGDAAFVRKLKPTLIKARIRGELPTDRPPGSDVVAPSAPQHGPRPKLGGGGPNPWVVVGVALAVGIVLAKVIDWRGHAHPRD